MSYRIEYTRKKAVRRPAQWSTSMKLSLISGIAAGLLLGIFVFFPNAVASLRQAILPRGEAVTTLIEDIQTGTDLSQAVTVFWEGLIHGAD